MLSSTSGVRILMRSRQRRASVRLEARRYQRTDTQLGERADADVLGDRPLRKYAVGLPVAGDQRHPTGHLVRAAPGGGEGLQQQISLAVAGEAREADDLAFMRDQLLTVALAFRPDANPDRRVGNRTSTARGLDARPLGGDPAHRGDQPLAVERRGGNPKRRLCRRA